MRRGIISSGSRFLVNSYETRTPEDIQVFCRRVFRTPSGRLLSLQSGQKWTEESAMGDFEE